MRRIILLLSIVVLAAAAPARAWCEASCLAPSHDAQAHCPSHEPASATTQMSGSAISECPALVSARPATPARVEVQATTHVTTAPLISQASFYPASAARPNAATTVFERCTPLRI